MGSCTPFVGLPQGLLCMPFLPVFLPALCSPLRRGPCVWSWAFATRPLASGTGQLFLSRRGSFGHPRSRARGLAPAPARFGSVREGGLASWPRMWCRGRPGPSWSERPVSLFARCSGMVRVECAVPADSPAGGCWPPSSFHKRPVGCAGARQGGLVGSACPAGVPLPSCCPGCFHRGPRSPGPWSRNMHLVVLGGGCWGLRVRIVFPLRWRG